MPICKHCYTNNNLEAKTCKKCCRVIPANEGYSCPKCMGENGPFAKQCKHCGYNLKNQADGKSQHHKQKTVNIFEKTKERQNDYSSLDSYDSAESKIHFKGLVDTFTRKTLFENYNELARGLRVSSTVTIHERGTYLSSGHGGYYHSDSNSIEIVDTYYIISALAHEMRHAYQHKYMPNMFYGDRVTSAREYVAAKTEVDAREYARNYCLRKKYYEELEVLEEQEREFNLFLSGRLSAEAIGIDDDYYRMNPRLPQLIGNQSYVDYPTKKRERKVYNKIGTKQQSKVYRLNNKNNNPIVKVFWLLIIIILLVILYRS